MPLKVGWRWGLAPAVVVLGIALAGVAPPAPARGAGSATEFHMAVWPAAAASPEFHLVDVDGQPRSLTDYRGHVVVVFFGFARCPDVCPAELYKLSLALRRLGAAGDQIRVLFVTLDPQRDSPQVLRDYVRAFDPQFIALTGGADQIDQAASSFHVEYARVLQGADYTIEHSTSVYVFGTRGQLRLVGSTKTSTADLAHDLGLLAVERP